MEFGPSFHEALLTPGQTPSNEFERVHAVNCDLLLIIGMEVRFVVWGAMLGEHSDDNPKKPTQFRHRPILAHSANGGVAAANGSIQGIRLADTALRDLPNCSMFVPPESI